MPSRPLSRPASAIRSPSPSSPSRRSAGTRTSSKRMVAVAEPVSPILRSGASALSPSTLGGDEEAGDPVAAVAGACHHLVEVGVPSVGGPGLRAVEDVRVAVAAGRRAHGRRVGSRVRLGEAVGAQQLTAEHVGQPPPPLVVGARGHQPEARQCVHADPHPDARPDGGDLLEHLEVDLVGLTTAAVLLVVGQAEQARATEQPEHLAREALLRLGARGERQQLVGRQVADQPEQVDGLLGRQVAAGGHRFPLVTWKVSL